MSNTRRGKKLNSNKNYRARAEFIAHQRENRPKQVWIPPSFVEHTGQPVDGRWEKVAR